MANSIDQNKLIEELSSFKGQWFVVNCITGLEEKVKEDLLQKVRSQNLSNFIFDIIINKGGTLSKDKKRTIEINKFPGYFFINMIMTDETWFVVRNTPGVTGFIGSSGKGTKPFPITTEEVSKIILNANLKSEKAIRKATFNIGDILNVVAGSFVGYEGKVSGIDESKGVVTIEIELLGRITPVHLGFDDVVSID